MSAILVTAGGFGGAWLFASKAQAWAHPLHRDGDAVVCNEHDVAAEFSTLEWPALMARCGLPCTMPPQGAGSYKLRKAYRNATAPAVWAALLRLAKPAPTEARVVAAQKARDTFLRRKHKVDTEYVYGQQPVEEVPQYVEEFPQPVVEGEQQPVVEGEQQPVVEGEQQPVEGGEAAPKPKRKRTRKAKDPNAPPKQRKPRARKAKDPSAPRKARKGSNGRGFHPDWLIFFGTDPKGNPYNTTTNHPRRKNSAAGQRFNNYRDGATVGEVMEKGTQSGDLLWDMRHGYITIVAPTQQGVATQQGQG